MRTVQTLTVGSHTIVLTHTPGDRFFPYGVDVWRPAGQENAEIFDMPATDLILALQVGAHDLPEAEAEFAQLAEEYAA